MKLSRRLTVRSLMAATLAAAAKSQDAQDPSRDDNRLHLPKTEADEPRLPNGKLQRLEIAKEEHVNALKDAETLVETAQELRDELKRAGEYVVPVASLRKTEEIEKLAKRIRGRLKN